MLIASILIKRVAAIEGRRGIIERLEPASFLDGQVGFDRRSNYAIVRREIAAGEHAVVCDEVFAGDLVG